MARKTQKRIAAAAPVPVAAEPRTVMLAGIGALSLGRRQLLRAYADGFQGVADARDRALDAFVSAAARVDTQVDGLRRQAGQWRRKAEAYRGQVEHRFGPVLEKFGVKVRTPRARRKPARRKRPA